MNILGGGDSCLIDRCQTLLAPPTLPALLPNLDFSKPKSNHPVGLRTPAGDISVQSKP